MNPDSAIHYLPKLRPSKPVRYGFMKVLGGTVLMLTVLILGFCGIAYIESGWILGVLLGIVLIGIAAVCVGLAGYYLADGVVSLRFLMAKRDEDSDPMPVYYHNGGYLHHPTEADYMFGKRVVPVNSLEMLKSGRKEWYFMNGVTLKIISERKYDYGGEAPNIRFALNMECNFAGGTFSVKYDTGDEGHVRELRCTEFDQRYVLVEFQGKDLHICDFGAGIGGVGS